MTIDKAIAKIWHCIVSIRDCVGNKEFVEALELSVETMRKYQKIESKIKVLRHFTEDTPLATQRMIKIVNEIREVLEDGND